MNSVIYEKFSTDKCYKATVLGWVALLLWSLDATLYYSLRDIPVFEILSILGLMVFSLTLLRLHITKRWSVIRQQPISVWLFGVIGIYATNICYLNALRYAPPQQVILINYLWPIFAAYFSGIFNDEKFSSRNYLVLLVGLLSLFILNYKEGAFTFKVGYLKGYLFALMMALFWSGYIVKSRRVSNIPIEMVGMYFGIGAIISIVMHFSFEASVLPSNSQILLLLVIGLLTQFTTYYLWQIGIQKGNLALLNQAAYLNPILSVSWLIIFGYAVFTVNLVIAFLLLVLALIWARPKVKPIVVKAAIFKN